MIDSVRCSYSHCSASGCKLCDHLGIKKGSYLGFFFHLTMCLHLVKVCNIYLKLCLYVIAAHYLHIQVGNLLKVLILKG